MINDVYSSECNLTPKALRKRGRNENGANNIKNVMMFLFCMTILLIGVRTRPLRKGNDYLKRIGKIYHYILEHYLIERL